ncbi:MULTISPECIES: ABC transporter permease [Nonomuraea]|jgi:peptide/nickel transport system permease protein|uniref:ABC transporter permease n=2 Tax=Nonomuraea TaxID=83681 RepID=A0ABW1CA27_9ACTN|nr:MULTISPECIES: ABC transporter permease [Nonomuraea]MDA0646145.1 ABC transporter permease [Nonomuraea ferruginea]TXK40252.1 ABC transporter permease [Nonomuraea sp. C10]
MSAHAAAKPRTRRRVPVVEGIALAVAALVVLMAVAGPLLAPYDPYAVDLSRSLLPPSAEHWLGTDSNGRDVLSRVLYGARVTLPATLVVIAASTLIGLLIGTLAALGGKVVDEVLMRITDIGLSLPAIILALGLAAALGPGLSSAVIALSLTWWPGYARLVRTLVREVKDAEYVDAARVMGVPQGRLIFRHILPNALNTLYVQTTVDVGAVMLVISGLSFIGVGAQVPSSEWGAMIAGEANNLTNAWWAVAFPGLALLLTALAFNLVGDWLRVRNDPTIRQEAR